MKRDVRIHLRVLPDGGVSAVSEDEIAAGNGWDDGDWGGTVYAETSVLVAVDATVQAEVVDEAPPLAASA